MTDSSTSRAPTPLHALIVGAGVSGLTAGRLMQRRGHRVTIVDARDRPGGRVRTTTEGVDLGPSWLWPAANPRLTAMVDDLGLEVVRQPVQGAGIFETPAQRMRIPTWEQGSMRLVGGMVSLIEALRLEIGTAPGAGIEVDRVVRELALDGEGVRVRFGPEPAGQGEVFDRVILAIPPRVLAETIRFDPALPAETTSRWAATPTWMASHAKFVALYESPFWRENGLSGFASSQIGPLGEIHDASPVMATGEVGQASEVPRVAGALFGFVGLPPRARSEIGFAGLVESAVAQLTRLFGPAASSPLRIDLQDWATEPFTARDADRAGFGDHPPTQSALLPFPWQGRVALAGSEFAATTPGYLEGAAESAAAAVGHLDLEAPGSRSGSTERPRGPRV